MPRLIPPPRPSRRVWRESSLSSRQANAALEGRGDRLGPEGLGLLAKRFAAVSDPVEAARIKERLTRGFYGI